MKTKSPREKRKISIIVQVAILFLIGVLATGMLTYICETRLSGDSVQKQTERHAGEIADEAMRAVTEYPAYRWLIRYWYSHPEAMEIEYDALFSKESETEEKCRLFSQRHPELQLRYLDEAQCEALPEEDQRLYAEIAYSWLITRIDQIKQAYHADYLFCVITEEPFDRQFFLFSGAEPGAVRGTSYEEVYPLGKTVTVGESQSLAMRSAIRNSSHLADAGNYVDYYAMLCSFDGHSVLIGLTYDLSALQADMRTQTRAGATLAILNQLVLSTLSLGLILFFKPSAALGANPHNAFTAKQYRLMQSNHTGQADGMLFKLMILKKTRGKTRVFFSAFRQAFSHSSALAAEMRLMVSSA